MIIENMSNSTWTKGKAGVHVQGYMAMGKDIWVRAYGYGHMGKGIRVWVHGQGHMGNGK